MYRSFLAVLVLVLVATGAFAGGSPNNRSSGGDEFDSAMDTTESDTIILRPGNGANLAAEPPSAQTMAARQVQQTSQPPQTVKASLLQDAKDELEEKDREIARLREQLAAKHIQTESSQATQSTNTAASVAQAQSSSQPPQIVPVSTDPEEVMSEWISYRPSASSDDATLQEIVQAIMGPGWTVKTKYSHDDSFLKYAKYFFVAEGTRRFALSELRNEVAQGDVYIDYLPLFNQTDANGNPTPVIYIVSSR